VPVTTIAILPFHNMTGDAELEWMENGIQEMLITDISQSSSLRPVLRDRVDRILHELGKDGQNRFDQQTLQLISDAAGVGYALHGSFVESQGRLRMDLTLRQSDTGVGTPVKIERASNEVFELVDELTRRVSSELNLDSFGSDRPLTELSTRSLPALRSYYQARGELQKGANQSAIPLLKQAIEQDPKLAMAHARLAETYFHLGDQANAVSSISTARNLADTSRLPVVERYQIHAIAARIQDDPQTAVASYRELAKLFPEDPDILNSLASSLETRGEAGESVEVYRRVLQIAPGHGAALLGLGRTMVVSGHPDDAIPLLQKASESGQFEGDDETLGMIYSILGVAYSDMGQFDPAANEFERSLAHRRRTASQRAIATSLNNLASALKSLGRDEEARRFLDEALGIAKEVNDETMESLALLNLGNIENKSGRFERALVYYRRSLDIEWERNEHTELAIRLNNIADVLRRQGLHADALVYLKLAQSYLDRSEDLKNKARNLWSLGLIEKARANYGAAQSAFLERLQLARQIGANADAAETQLLLAILYADQGRFEEALGAVDSVIEILPPDDKLMTKVHLTRTEIWLKIGATTRAESELASAIRGLDPHQQEERLQSDLLAAILARLSGKAPKQFVLENTARAAATASFVELELRTLIEVGTGTQTDSVPGVAVLERARARAADAGFRVIQADASLELAKTYFRSRRWEEARRLASEAISLGELFEGRPMIAESRFLLASIADATAQVDLADTLRQQVHEIVGTVLAQTPPGLTGDFIARHAWAQQGATSR
jgi:tetratricopeptide (TPR) repeat protein